MTLKEMYNDIISRQAKISEFRQKVTIMLQRRDAFLVKLLLRKEDLETLEESTSDVTDMLSEVGTDIAFLKSHLDFICDMESSLSRYQEALQKLMS